MVTFFIEKIRVTNTYLLEKLKLFMGVFREIMPLEVRKPFGLNRPLSVIFILKQEFK